MLLHKPSSRVRFLCSKEEKQAFSSSHCIVAVSVIGQPRTDGEKFAAILKKVNQYFDKCTILVCDTLQRHTFAIYEPEKPASEYYDLSLQAGDEWLQRNQSAIDSLTIPHVTQRWDQWLQHSNFKAMKTLIDEFCEQNIDFHQAVYVGVKEYLLRLDKNYKEVNCTKAFKYSIEYLREESTILQLMAAQDFDYILYPNKRPKVMELTYNYFIQPYFPNRMRWIELEVKLKKKNQNSNKNSLASTAA
ncbi:MAG: hypothetical protein K0Q57_753 [Gammaproteobacteria bacterium]|nr:hypothetical protein [Gammaproteobacteria bacterium]